MIPDAIATELKQTVKQYNTAYAPAAIMKRQLKTQPLDSQKQEQLRQGLKQLGVSLLDNGKDQYTLFYDARYCQWEKVNALCDTLDISLLSSWFYRFKTSFYASTDTNCKHNFAATPGCCNKPPK